jgi:hypothetical protein
MDGFVFSREQGWQGPRHVELQAVADGAQHGWFPRRGAAHAQHETAHADNVETVKKAVESSGACLSCGAATTIDAHPVDASGLLYVHWPGLPHPRRGRGRGRRASRRRPRPRRRGAAPAVPVRPRARPP